MSSLAQIHSAIEQAFPAHLDAIRAFVRTPSISAEGTGMPETAETVRGFIEAVGGHGEVVPTAGHPVVYGEIDAGQPKTLLIYSMYDVQPVAGEDWLVPPFGGNIVDLPGHGPCIVSRGIHNTKGPLRAFFNTLAVMREHGGLPVNLKFIIEGEEELGSPHLADFIAGYKDRLKADAVLFPFFTLDSKGKAILYLGAKGNIKVVLTCQGGEWGGPTIRGIHSRNAAWVASPVWRLVHALATLVGPDEALLVKGIYDRILAPTEEDEQLLQQLEPSLDEPTLKDEIDVVRFKYDLHGADLLRKYLYSPTININGLKAGHIEAGVKTVLPHLAEAKLDIRLAPDMTVDDTLAKIRAHLDAHGFTNVAMEKRSGYPASRTSVSEPAAQAMIQTCRDHGFEPEIWPYLPGSAPFHLFTQVLGLPLIMGGLAHGGRAHSPNEYAVISQLELFERSMATLLHHFGGANGSGPAG